MWAAYHYTIGDEIFYCLEMAYKFIYRGPVLAMDMAPTGDMCYTGGFDGAICCWVVPSVNIDPHDVYGIVANF